MTLYSGSHNVCAAYKSLLSEALFAPVRPFPFEEQ
jgi:hypothetical protein